MDVTTGFFTQDIWTWWLAIYLYFGGLGAATLTTTFLTDMYLKPHRELVLWGAWSGIVMLSIGSGMLFLHLLDHMAVIHVLNPMVLINQPTAWIAWGTQFIVWMMVWGFLYSLPYMIESEFFGRIPIVKNVLAWSLIQKIGHTIHRHKRLVGWLATINGIGTVIYTGLLLQSFPAVALWHNPGVPLLFTVSAFSTAMAFLLLLLNLAIKKGDEDHLLRVFYERTDLMLIAAELVILFSFFFYLQRGSQSAAISAQLLWNDWGWLIGFMGFGLLVPFFIELKGVIKGWNSPVPIMLASVLVLVGGYLLRHYFMYAGVYARPW
jgi:polysulfide reductase chain C